MGLLSFIANPMAALQMIGVAVAAIGIGFAGGYVKGFDSAVAKYQVAALQQEVADWKKASDDLAKQLDEDRKIADVYEQEATVLRNRIKGIVDAQPVTPAACRLNERELRELRAVARQAGS